MAMHQLTGNSAFHITFFPYICLPKKEKIIYIHKYILIEPQSHSVILARSSTSACQINASAWRLDKRYKNIQIIIMIFSDAPKKNILNFCRQPGSEGEWEVGAEEMRTPWRWWLPSASTGDRRQLHTPNKHTHTHTLTHPLSAQKF